jgi:hypothetical protein
MGGTLIWFSLSYIFRQGVAHFRITQEMITTASLEDERWQVSIRGNNLLVCLISNLCIEANIKEELCNILR